MGGGGGSYEGGRKKSPPLPPPKKKEKKKMARPKPTLYLLMQAWIQVHIHVETVYTTPISPR